MDFEQITKYLGTLPLAEAMWWFIENIPDHHEFRTPVFFYLRERVRESQGAA